MHVRGTANRGKTKFKWNIFSILTKFNFPSTFKIIDVKIQYD